MIGAEYRKFLEEALEDARRWGPHNGAVLRKIELGTVRLLLAPAAEAEARAPRDEVSDLQRRCQDELRPIWARGPFGHEISHWPSGPGSARAMELIYANDPGVADVAAHYTESFLLTRDLAHAVRSRRDVLREILRTELRARRGDVRVLDLACGPCQSLREALPVLEAPGRIDLLAVDTDGPMQAANRAFFHEERGLPWRFETANALRFDMGVGANHIVYSTGLYDYVGSRALAGLWRKVYASLAPGGVAILSVKDGARFCSLVYRWAVAWSQFYIRTERDFAAILAEAGLPSPEKVERDATGCVLFYSIRKPA